MSILSSTKTGKTAFLIPETKEELMELIKKEIYEKGWKCDLNHIQTHKITDMSCIFMYANKFNGDISKWNVSNVENMSDMFYYSDFNGDISNWDVSNVKNMQNMFLYSEFNNDISNWKINSKCDTTYMFRSCNIKDEYKPKK
jgi:surface protein